LDAISPPPFPFRESDEWSLCVGIPVITQDCRGEIRIEKERLLPNIGYMMPHHE
jgi:hypothetical protein